MGCLEATIHFKMLNETCKQAEVKEKLNAPVNYIILCYKKRVFKS